MSEVCVRCFDINEVTFDEKKVKNNNPKKTKTRKKRNE